MLSDTRPQDAQRVMAIETEYNGYRFRSRLEARWAVFLDALGVKYEYEPEGFELPSGKKYLPDFRVKCHGTRGECIDPSMGMCMSCRYGREDDYSYQGDCTCEEAERDEYGCVAGAISDGDANGICVSCPHYDGPPFDLYIEVKGHMTQDDADRIREFVGSGVPENPTLIVGNIPVIRAASDAYDFHGDNQSPYERMDGIDIYAFNYETIDGDHFGAYPAAHDGMFYLWGDDNSYVNREDVVNVALAYRKARQARFEHGESPDTTPTKGTQSGSTGHVTSLTWRAWLRLHMPKKQDGHEGKAIEQQRAVLEHELRNGDYERYGPFIERVIAHLEKKASDRRRVMAIIEFLLGEIPSDSESMPKTVKAWDESGAYDRFVATYPDGIPEIGVEWDTRRDAFIAKDFMVARSMMRRCIGNMSPDDTILSTYECD